MSTFEQEISVGQRFEFGENWRAFLTTLTDERIQIAEDSIRNMLEIADLENNTMIDVGSGSGLFSLAARRLGATVTSFDFDPTSVACTRELRSRFFPNDPNWIVEKGSVLDAEFLGKLGTFDVVYSWGVLHHSGDMWAAMDNAASLVNKGGTLYIGIYNDQGRTSRLWRRVKKLFCSGIVGKAIVTGLFIPYFFLRTLAASILKRQRIFAEYKKNRGMSITHDWFDWLGGFPFEVAKVEDVFRFYRRKGFSLKNVKTVNDLGINEFVFVRE